MSKFDKEKFLQEISTFPRWVKNGDDLMRFCKHLQYRLEQKMAMVWWYSKKTKLTDEEELELTYILKSYDDAYNNDTSQLMPFGEVF